MTHPIIDLQISIVSKHSAEADLIALIGANAIFDMPPKGKSSPFIVVLRHNLIVHDFDNAPGNDHRIQMKIWVPEPNRSSVLAIADRVTSVLVSQDLSTPTLLITNARHQRTDTAIDLKSGRANAMLVFRILSEPVV